MWCSAPFFGGRGTTKMDALKKFFDGFSTVVLILLAVLVLVLHATKPFGIKPFAVLSGSMEPSYHTGSLVYVKSVAPEEIEVGDPITFTISGSTVVTHRVVEIDPVQREFTTKGDANDTNDSAIGFDCLIGRVVFTVPLLGYAAVFLAAPYGKAILILLFALSVVMIFLSEALKKKKE